MKQYIFLVLCGILVCGRIAMGQSPDVQITGPAGAGVKQIRVDVNPSSAGYQVARRVVPGQFDVDVIIFNLNQATNCASFTLHYDPAAVDFVGLQGAALFGTDPNPTVIDNPGAVQVLMEQGTSDPCPLPGVSGTGLLARLRFTSLAPDVQTGFDAQPGTSGWQGPPMCQTSVVGQDYSAASGVVVIGDATISCLNVNVINDLDALNVPAGNPRCNAALGNGDISLRSAIKIANTVTGGNHPTFRIPMADPTIVVAAGRALSDLTGGTFLDGTTQPLGTVHIDGPAGLPALSLTSNGNTVKKLAFINSGTGLLISGSDNTASASRFGIRSNDAAAPNVEGIRISGGSNNGIGGLLAADGNVISNNASGVVISGGSGAQVRGNKIGTNGAGLAARPNTIRGVYIIGSTSATIGGAAAGARNIISGNAGDGIEIAGTNGHFVHGNYIGVNNTGNVALSNLAAGVYLNGAGNNTIGDGTASGRNIISANVADGVEIALATSSGNVVQGNYIGLGADGTALLGNGQAGVYVNGAPSNTVGGSGAGGRNVISDNATDGVLIDLAAATNNSVINNAIGMNAAGALGGNGRDGVRIRNGAHTNFVGGEGGFDVIGNEIVDNVGDGVSIIGGADNEVVDNAIGQTFAGIDLPNTDNGVSLTGGASSNTIESNSIHANGLNGVLISGAGTNMNDILQNSIGEHEHGNDLNGVLINLGAQMNHLSLNNIEENGSLGSPPVGSGIEISDAGTDGNIIVANGIGGNLASGVLISDGPAANEIGGEIPEAGNIISGNFVSGVFLTGAAFNRIQRNDIHHNSLSGITIDSFSNNLVSRNLIHDNFPAAGLPGTGLAIDLSVPGMTANDSADGDIGGNSSQNYPVLSSAIGGAITGTLDSTPEHTFNLEVFANAACDPSGHGEAESYLGNMMVATNSGGIATFLFTVLPAPEVGTFITATATDITPLPGLPANNTSELSACVVVTRGSPACLADIAPSGGDGVVDVDDLLLVINSWGACVGCPADVAPQPIVDGQVDVDDLLTIINAWGLCP